MTTDTSTKKLTLLACLTGLCLVAIIATFRPSPAAADDYKIACVQVGDDAGSTGFVALSNNRQIMARCEGYATRHMVGIGSGTLATSTSSIIDADKSIDLCIDLADTRISFYKQYDAGNPQCCVYSVRPRTGVCP